VYLVAERLLDDRDDLVCKATGWLLRDAGRTDRARLEVFLRQQGPRLSRTTIRYAIEHFSPEIRAVLLRDTRGV
jgi:3-methyladenine DNA glycosylase AlkD